ncbi:MAG: hypothetical protein Q4D50_08395 [Eubacteriales bacterium]|nr:hypothetical protein [Eubacteriales bacterium]
MKKKSFVVLLLGVVGGLLFGIGMCMCLLPEWDVFRPGVAVTAVGAVFLLVLLAVLLKGRAGSGRKINWKTVGKAAFGILGALVLGAGMCMIMVWDMLLPGIAVGVAGIVLLLCLIPMCLGLK